MATLMGITDELRRRQRALEDAAADGAFDISEWQDLERAYAMQGRVSGAYTCRKRYQYYAARVACRLPVDDMVEA